MTGDSKEGPRQRGRDLAVDARRTAILTSVDVLVVRDHTFPEGKYEGVSVTVPFNLDEDKLFPA